MGVEPTSSCFAGSRRAVWLQRQLVSQPGIEPGLRASRARVRIQHTPRTCCWSVPRQGVEPRLVVSKTTVRPSHSQGISGNRRRKHRRLPIIDSYHSQSVRFFFEPLGLPSKYPDLDLNQGLDLRRVQCFPLQHRDVRADDWIRTSMIPLTRRTPFCIEPRRHQGVTDGS